MSVFAELEVGVERQTNVDTHVAFDVDAVDFRGDFQNVLAKGYAALDTLSEVYVATNMLMWYTFMRLFCFVELSASLNAVSVTYYLHSGGRFARPKKRQEKDFGHQRQRRELGLDA